MRVVARRPSRERSKYSERRSSFPLKTKMSTFVPEQIHVQTETDQFDLKGFTCELSANAFVPPTRRNQPKERNYFNSHKEVNRETRRDEEVFFIGDCLVQTFVDLRSNLSNSIRFQSEGASRRSATFEISRSQSRQRGSTERTRFILQIDPSSSLFLLFRKMTNLIQVDLHRNTVVDMLNRST